MPTSRVRWRAIKTAFVKFLPVGEPRSPVTTSRGELGFWRWRYWEHTIRDDQDFPTHMDCTHFNPVRHGLVEHPADLPQSSFRRCVAGRPYAAHARGSAARSAPYPSGLQPATYAATGRQPATVRGGKPALLLYGIIEFVQDLI
jgi:hypothetical protein